MQPLDAPLFTDPTDHVADHSSGFHLRNPNYYQTTGEKLDSALSLVHSPLAGPLKQSGEQYTYSSRKGPECQPIATPVMSGNALPVQQKTNPHSSSTRFPGCTICSLTNLTISIILTGLVVSLFLQNRTLMTRLLSVETFVGIRANGDSTANPVFDGFKEMANNRPRINHDSYAPRGVTAECLVLCNMLYWFVPTQRSWSLACQADQWIELRNTMLPFSGTTYVPLRIDPVTEFATKCPPG
ncbi:hypothetical protein CSKR_102726 [Clonorchis sinensis]|uniref:Uncharacterized protein n=1 Tax=Clonorchis sinensis TaxID=79923 RepID=A0A3R7JVE7_CLOSI|nr:hypothetical protein CSKR_102726 [Clonorchis sinensis]